MRDKGAMKNTIKQGKVEVPRDRGRSRRLYIDDIRDWTGMDLTTSARRTEDRERWKEEVSRWVHQWPTRPRS